MINKALLGNPANYVRVGIMAAIVVVGFHLVSGKVNK